MAAAHGVITASPGLRFKAMSKNCLRVGPQSRHGVAHKPERSGLPSGDLGAGAARFGLPSGKRGMPGVGVFNHCACADTVTSNTAATATSFPVLRSAMAASHVRGNVL